MFCQIITQVACSPTFDRVLISFWKLMSQVCISVGILVIWTPESLFNSSYNNLKLFELTISKSYKVFVGQRFLIHTISLFRGTSPLLTTQMYESVIFDFTLTKPLIKNKVEDGHVIPRAQSIDGQLQFSGSKVRQCTMRERPSGGKLFLSWQWGSRETGRDHRKVGAFLAWPQWASSSSRTSPAYSYNLNWNLNERSS